MNGVISVVVPVYNVAAYLSQCLDSILSQDYEQLEVLLIDDGSTDDSGEICDGYARRDGRVQVIHQKNGGAAAAKNAGLRAAAGKYLSFVDGDDFLEPGAYSHMVGLMRETEADVVQCAYRDVFRERTEDQIRNPGRHVFSGKDYLIRYTVDWTCALMTDKLFKRRLYAGVFFEEGHRIDDEYFTYQGILNAGRVVCDDRVVYNYRRRASSVMLSPRSAGQIAMDRIDYLDKRRQNVLARYPELRREFDLHYLGALLDLSIQKNNTRESLERIKTQLCAYLREKGSTRVGPRTWLKLRKLIHTDTDTLLKRCAVEDPMTDLQDLFD